MYRDHNIENDTHFFEKNKMNGAHTTTPHQMTQHGIQSDRHHKTRSISTAHQHGEGAEISTARARKLSTTLKRKRVQPSK
jgi:hypothetical protein